MKKANIILVILSTMLLLTGVVSYADTVNTPDILVTPALEKAAFITKSLDSGMPQFGFAIGSSINVNRVNLEDYKDLTVSEKKEKLLAEFKTALEKWNGEDAFIFEASKLDKAFMEKFDTAIAKDFVFDLPGEFDEKTLAEVKEKLLKSITENINAQVDAKVITREEGDKRINDLKAELEKWDGKSPFNIKMGEGDVLFFKVFQGKEQQ